MRFLLDVNVLVAWGWADHVDHERVAKWIALTQRQSQNYLLTSVIPQLGFVRVSVQRTSGLITVQEACKTLAGMLNTLRSVHSFLPDDQPGNLFPNWCQSPSRTTDAHLLQLADAHQAQLATLDTAIPRAFLIPAS